LLRLNLAELEAAMSLDLMNEKSRRLFTSETRMIVSKIG
jgi:hypothetical protein